MNMRDLSRNLSTVVLAILILACGIPVLAQTISYSYDSNGRLVQMDYDSGNSVTYEYDLSNNTVREVYSTAGNLLQVVVSPDNAGTVSGDGINCPPDCSGTFTNSSEVTLTAAPTGGLQFLGWGADLAGASNTATFTMAGDRLAAAYFGAADGQTDTDGIADLVEMGPNGDDSGYDGNNDGIADYQQSSVASLPTFDGQAYATLAVP